MVTSSIAAIRLAKGAEERALTEEDWTDPDDEGLTPYVRSKTIAEQAAWDLVEQRGEEDRLAVVNPGAIIGPVLNDDLSYSLQAIERLLQGMPGMPRLGFSFVDVRDVADLEIRAMTSPEAGGQRFIAVTKFLWMSEAGEVLRERLGEGASKVPDPDDSRPSRAGHGPVRRRHPLDRRHARQADASSPRRRPGRTLGWSPRPIEDTIAETGESLIEHGAAPASAAA